MKVFVAGATGALGKQLVPKLVGVRPRRVGNDSQRVARRARQRPRGAAGGPRRARRRRGRRSRERGRAGCDRAPAHGALGRARPAPLRADVRADQPPAHRGHRHPAVGRARSGHAALRRPELRGLAVRAHRRPGEDRGGPARHRSACGGADDERGDPLSRAGGHPGRLDRGHRASLWGLLWPGHVAGARPARRDAGDDPQAKVPDRRRRRRRLVVHPHRGCGRGDPAGGRVGRAGDLQRRRRRARAGVGVAARGLRGAAREAADAGARAGSAGSSPARRRR